MAVHVLPHHLERDGLTFSALRRVRRRKRNLRHGRVRVHEAAHLVRGLELYMVGDMGVRIQCEASAVVAQHIGHRFHVSFGLQRQGRECIVLIV